MNQEALLAEFEAFRGQAIDLDLLVWTHEKLFEQGFDQNQLLKKTSPWFFNDLSRWCVDLYILKAGRLTDPRKSHGFANLTVAYFVDSLKTMGCLTDIAAELSQNIHNYRKNNIVDARRKLVAHLDKEMVLAGETLGGHTSEEQHQFLRDLNQFCDEVADSLGGHALDFRGHSSEGDVLDLINVLERGQHCIAGHSDDRS